MAAEREAVESRKTLGALRLAILHEPGRFSPRALERVEAAEREIRKLIEEKS